jgi:hypothetical protein
MHVCYPQSLERATAAEVFVLRELCLEQVVEHALKRRTQAGLGVFHAASFVQLNLGCASES